MKPSTLFNTIELHDASFKNILYISEFGMLNVRLELSRHLQPDYIYSPVYQPMRGWLHFTQVEDFDIDPPLDFIDWSSMSGDSSAGFGHIPERDRDGLQALEFLILLDNYKSKQFNILYTMRFLCGDVLWLPDSEDPGGASLLQVLKNYLRYRESGILTPGGLAFTPNAALSLLCDMTEIGVHGLGMTEWYLYNSEPPHWMATNSIDINPFPLAILPGVPAKSSTEVVAAFIESDLPANTAYVSLYFSYPAAWNPILHAVWKLVPGPTDPLGKDTPVPGNTRRFAQVLLAFLTYRDRSFSQAGELRFTSNAALGLLDDMAKLEIACRGVRGCDEAGSEPEPADMPEAAFSVPAEVLHAPDAALRSAGLVRTFIEPGLAARPRYICLDFDLPEEWQTVLARAWQQIPGPTSKSL